MDNIRPIRTDDDLAWAIAEVERLMDVEPAAGSADADRFDVLSDLIEAYENRVHPVADLDPVEFLKAHMQNTGRTQSDLAVLLGSRSRASEILNRRRALTVDMIHKLGSWGIPASVLVVPYALVA